LLVKNMSPSSSRYKSRLFNFIFLQTRRVGESCERAVKQLQVASVWGTQILLFPLYAIIQTTRLAGKQLNQSPEAAGETIPPADTRSHTDPPPTVDTPWQQVLAVAQTFELPETVTVNFLTPVSNFTLAPAPQPTQPTTTKTTSVPQKKTTQTIQGCASLISTQAIVLVTTNNEVLDILTPSQQQTLRRRIIQEVEQFDRHYRLAAAKSRLQTHTLPSENSTSQPSLRHWVLDWITWMQEGPVASALNWFQETAPTLRSPSLPSNTSEITETPAIPPLISPQAWSVVNQTLTTVQALSLPSVAAVKTAIIQRSQQLVTDVQKLSVALVSDPTPMAVPATDTQTVTQDQLGIHALIHAAVEYFFKQRSKNLLESETLSPHFAYKHLLETPESQISDNRLPFQKQPQALPSDTETIPDPWLSLKDLFGKSTKTPQTPTTTSPATALPASPKVTPSAGKSRPKFTFKKNNQINIIPQSEIKNNPIPVKKPSQPASKPVKQTQTDLKPRKTANSQPAGITNKPQRQQAGSVKHTPDWIETEATPLGYVQHPLERLLQWLDRLMLWLEEVIIALWQQMRKK
jgi:hypothetical protein